MRSLLIIAVCVGALASVALCGSYGWDQGGGILKDQVTQAFVFGFVAAATLFLHGLALRMWVNGWRISGSFVGIVAMLAFMMTAFTSLGGLASRSDKMLAERQDVLDTRADTKKQIDDLIAERKGLKFTRATQAVVDAAQRTVDTAKLAREQECGDGGKKVGENCRKRQDAEATANDKLTAAQTNKANTDRFDEIEVEIRRLRGLKTGVSVGAADPLKALLTTIFGAWGSLVSAWQKAVFAVIYDLVLVALMIGIEVLGHTAAPAKRARDEQMAPDMSTKPEIVSESAEPVAAAPITEPELIRKKLPPPPRPKLATARKSEPAGPIPRIMTAALDRAKGQRVVLEDTFHRYAADSRAEGRAPVRPDVFMDAMARFCRGAGIKTKIENDRLYLLDVRLNSVPVPARQL